MTAAENGAPIRGAQLSMLPTTSGAGAPRQGRSTVTDEQGAYEFTELPAGRYRIRASKTGFVTMEYGQKPPYKTPGEPVIELAAAQALDRADFILPRGGIAVVTVTDPSGEPLAGVQVDLLQWRFANGRRMLTPTGTPVETNDLGQARSYGLMPGDYYVSVRPALGSGTTMYAPTYYPGTLAAPEAQRIPIASARETSVTVPVVAAKPGRISGVVRMSDGSPVRQSLELVIANPTGPQSYTVGLRQNTPGGGYTSNTISLKPDGTFDVKNVTPGDYSIDVRPALGGTPNPAQEFASVPVTVTGGDVITGLVVTTMRGATIHGQVTFDTGKPPDNLTPDRLRVAVFATGSDPNAITGSLPTMHDDFSFEITGVTGPGLLGLAGATAGWFTKSAVIDGKEATQIPFDFELGHDYKNVEVVLTEKRAVVTGQVTDAAGRPAQDYAVILFPEDRALWYPRSRAVFSGRPTTNGAFRIEQVPGGSYLAAAVDRLDPGEEQDAALLTALAERATPVVLRDGESKSIALRQAIRQEAR